MRGYEGGTRGRKESMMKGGGKEAGEKGREN